MCQKCTTEEFIKKAIAVHGDKYDYSRVVYKGRHEKVEIGCPRHGFFWKEVGKSERHRHTSGV